MFEYIVVAALTFAAMSVVAFAGAAFGLFWTRRLSSRVAELEREVGRLRLGQPIEAPAPVERPAEAPRPRFVLVESEPQPEAAPEPSDQDRPLVLREDRFADLGRWLKANWVYVIAAVSLALAGVFLVQYGIETGLLSPAARVAGAVLLGAALIGAGEFLRRRDADPGGPLAAVLAGAGLVSLFAAVVAARLLYDLIGPTPAMVALVLVAGLGVLLGWYHGAFLAAFGLLGAFAAPFAVGGSAEDPYWLYAYFVLVSAAGLAIDAARRWAWISVLALVLGYGGLWFLRGALGGAAWFELSLTVMPILAIAVPVLALVPGHGGATFAGFILKRGQGEWPSFPVRLAFGAMLASSVGLMLVPGVSGIGSVVALAGLTVLVLAIALWADRAPALADLAALPAVAFLVRLALEGIAPMPLGEEWFAQAIAFREPESAAPWTVGIVLGMALAMTLAAAWRSGVATEGRVAWAAGAALVAPVAAAALELTWAPSEVMGAYPWALHVIGLAALMTLLAQRFAAADAGDLRRAAHAVLAALSLIALALFVLVTKGALTVALGALVVVAAALDRRLRMPEMGWFIQAGVLVLGWRIVIDPGVIWAMDAPLWEVLLSFAGALAGMAGAFVLLPQGRNGARVFLESGFAAAAALFVNVLILRALDGSRDSDSAWSLSLNAIPWLVVALVQLYRMQLGGWMRFVRAGIAAVAGLIAATGLLAAIGPLNPLGDPFHPVRGPYVFDTLMVAYLLPAALILGALPRLGHLRRWLRLALGGVGVFLLALYVGLEIRRWWQGDDLSRPGVSQGELYSYTVAMMVVGAVLLWLALVRRSTHLRWAAMTVIVLTAAKVFLLDASGLSGLVRVVSFLLLGLALAGVAWLNRWAAVRTDEGPKAEAGPPGAPGL